jgi:hypothetical protein
MLSRSRELTTGITFQNWSVLKNHGEFILLREGGSMRSIWVAEYKSLTTGKWVYIGAQPKVEYAENLFTAYRLSNELSFSTARVRKFIFAPVKKKK